MHYANLRNGVYGSPGAAADPLVTLLAALGSDAKGVFVSPATTTTLVSGGVSVWTDQSGTGNLTCAASRPTLSEVGGRTGVTWAIGDNPLIRASIGVGPNFDLYARVRWTNGPNEYVMLAAFTDIQNAWAFIVQRNDTDKVRVNRAQIATSANITPTLAVDTTALLHVIGVGNTTWEAAWAGTIAKDGGAAAAASLPYAEATKLSIGPEQPCETGMTGAMLWYDLILCDPLDAAQQDAVAAYFAAT